MVLYKVFEVQGLRSPAAVEAESSPMFLFFEVGLVACLVSGALGEMLISFVRILNLDCQVSYIAACGFSVAFHHEKQSAASFKALP